MADTKHIVYKFVYLNEIIYIGKSDVGFDRIFSHDGGPYDNINAESKEEVQNSTVYYAEMANSTMADVYESELIRRYKPKYNKAKTSDWTGIPLPEPVWTMFRDYSDKRFEVLKRKLESMTKKYEAEHQKYLEANKRANEYWGQSLNKESQLMEMKRRVKFLDRELKNQTEKENQRKNAMAASAAKSCKRVSKLKDRIKEVAREKGISINRLEREAGIAKGAISHLDGIPKSIESVMRIADILGTTISELVQEETV